jgi:hypothetical protein
MRGEGGSVTAEFVVVMPAAIVVVALCLAGFSAVGEQVRLTDAAADVARLVARGDSAMVPGYLARVGGEVTVGVDSRDGVVCARLSSRTGIGPGQAVGVVLTAVSCAVGSSP